MATNIKLLFQVEKKSRVLTPAIVKTTPFIILVLTIAVLLVYHSVFSNQFQMNWDDQWVVFNFYTENGLTSKNLIEIFTDFFHGQYSPINQLAYTIIYSAAGANYNPVWFHTFSIMVHILNVTLTYFFIKNLLTQSKSFESSSVRTISFCTAFIMAIHPFLVESVAWMAASKIIIYAFFYLLAANVYLKYLTTKKIGYLVLVAVLFLFSFGAKEQAITLPACLLLIDYVLKRDLKSRAVWFEKIPFILLSLFFGYVTLLSQKADGVGLLTNSKHFPFYQDVIFGSYALTEYFVKCLVPVKLNFIYVFPNMIGQPVPVKYWIYPPLLLIIFITLKDVWKNRWILFAVGFFIIHLAVVLHIVPMSRIAIVADRYAYIASIGIFFLIAYFLDKAIKSKTYKNTAILSFMVFATYLGVYTNQHVKVWYNSDTLKKEAFDLMKKQQELDKQINKK